MSDAEGLSDPYSDTDPNLTPETPTLGSALAYALHQHSLGLRVALPCRIVAVNGNQLVDLQPLIMSRYTTSDSATLLPVLVNTLVAMPMGGDYRVRYPVAVGDIGYCIFCDRSLDVWASGKGGPVDPQDSRSHDLTDGVFYPGMVPVSGQTTDTTNDLVIQNGTAEIRLQKNGRFVVANAQNELLSLLDQSVATFSQLLQNLQAAVILTPIGPGSFAAVTLSQFAAMQQTVNVLRTNLDTLKGGLS